METKIPHLIVFVAVLLQVHASMLQFSSFRECSIAKKTANQANPSVGRLSTEMKRKMQACRVTLGNVIPAREPGAISIVAGQDPDNVRDLGAS